MSLLSFKDKKIGMEWHYGSYKEKIGRELKIIRQVWKEEIRGPVNPAALAAYLNQSIELTGNSPPFFLW